MRVGVVSDTHIPSRAPAIPPGVFEAFEGVHLILHAGDVSVRAALDELAALAPVHAVAGNIDDASLQVKRQSRNSCDAAQAVQRPGTTAPVAGSVRNGVE